MLHIHFIVDNIAVYRCIIEIFSKTFSVLQTDSFFILFLIVKM